MAKKVYDCHVTGICSGKNADFVRRMGADEVVDYTSVDVAETLLEKVREERVFDLMEEGRVRGKIVVDIS